jgi:hypothetical protein
LLAVSRLFGGGIGEGARKVGAGCGFGLGGAAHRRRQGTGRGEEGSAAAGPVLLHCGSGRGRKNLQASRVFQGSRAYIPVEIGGVNAVR